MTFSPEQVAALAGPLNRAHVKERTQAGRKLSYVEGWVAISEANRIFGFDAWTSETMDVRCVAENERTIGQAGNKGWGVSYIAKVRITVAGVMREGIGSGHGIDRDLGLAHESAIKEAETDARKRALMTFGNPFGLALYDKTQANVAIIRDEPDAEASRQRVEAAGGRGIREYANEDRQDEQLADLVDGREPAKSAYAARNDGDWQKIEAKFALADNVEKLCKLATWVASRNIPRAWHEQAVELWGKSLGEVIAAECHTPAHVAKWLTANEQALAALPPDYGNEAFATAARLKGEIERMVARELAEAAE